MCIYTNLFLYIFDLLHLHKMSCNHFFIIIRNTIHKKEQNKLTNIMCYKLNHMLDDVVEQIDIQYPSVENDNQMEIDDKEEDDDHNQKGKKKNKRKRKEKSATTISSPSSITTATISTTHVPLRPSHASPDCFFHAVRVVYVTSAWLSNFHNNGSSITHLDAVVRISTRCVTLLTSLLRLIQSPILSSTCGQSILFTSKRNNVS